MWKKADDEILNGFLQRAKVFSELRVFHEAKDYYEKAVKRCDELLKSSPRDSHLHYKKAVILYELRRFEGPDDAYAKRCKDALLEIDRAIELNPEIDYYHYLRNDILGELTYHPDWSLKWGWYGEFEIYAGLMFLGPSPNYVRGFAVDADGAPLEICSEHELDAIEHVYKESLEKYPRDPDCHNNLGAIYYEKGIWYVNASHVEKAIKKLNEAIALNPDNPAYYSNRALALYSLIRFGEEAGELKGNQINLEKLIKEVFNDLEKAIELDPWNPYYHYNLGLMLYETERYEEAVREFDEAIALDSSNPYYHYKKGMTLYMLGKYDESLEQLREALKLDKDSRVINYMIDLVETVKNGERRNIPLSRTDNKAITVEKEEDEVFLQPSDLQPDEVLSRAKELMSIAQKFGLIDPSTSKEELEKMKKWLAEELFKRRIRLDSLMLSLCSCCPAYRFDTEMIYGPEDYVKLASRLSGITRGLLPLGRIECQEVRLPGKQEPEKYVLSFVAWGEKYTVELPFEDDWAQYEPIVRLLDAIMEKRGGKERYVCLNTMDQTACLIFCIPENYEACRKVVAELLLCWSSSKSIEDD